MWWMKLNHKKLWVSCWTAYILQDGTWSLQYQVNIMAWNSAGKVMCDGESSIVECKQIRTTPE